MTTLSLVRSRSFRILVPLALCGLAVPTATNASAPETLKGDLTVYAAASLTDAFAGIEEAFEEEYDGVDVSVETGASSDLVDQINEGAPADVFASADQNNMDKLVDAGNNASEPETFATNSLAIIVEPGNPQGITGVESLTDSDLIFVTTAPEVPIGAYTQEVFEAAGIEVTSDSEEENVRAIVDKVVEGEADAGVVYITDVLAAGDDAEGVEIPVDINIVAEYPIAVTAEAANPDAAAAFVEFVVSEDGQAILAENGFGPIDAATTETSGPADTMGTDTMGTDTMTADTMVPDTTTA